MHVCINYNICHEFEHEFERYTVVLWDLILWMKWCVEKRLTIWRTWIGLWIGSWLNILTLNQRGTFNFNPYPSLPTAELNISFIVVPFSLISSINGTKGKISVHTRLYIYLQTHHSVHISTSTTIPINMIKHIFVIISSGLLINLVLIAVPQYVISWVDCNICRWQRKRDASNDIFC